MSEAVTQAVEKRGPGRPRKSEKATEVGAAAPAAKALPGEVSQEYYDKFKGDKRVNFPGDPQKFGQAVWGDDPDEMVLVTYFTGPDGDKSDIIVPHPDHITGGKYFLCKRNVEQPILKRALYHMEHPEHIAWEQDLDERDNPVGPSRRVVSTLYPYKIVGPYEPEDKE